jgi:hypothetical protein
MRSRECWLHVPDIPGVVRTSPLEDQSYPTLELFAASGPLAQINAMFRGDQGYSKRSSPGPTPRDTGREVHAAQSISINNQQPR